MLKNHFFIKKLCKIFASLKKVLYICINNDANEIIKQLLNFKIMETHIYIDYSELTLTVVKVWRTAGGFESSEKIHSIKPSKFFISSYEKIDKLLKRYSNPTRVLVNK